MISSEDLCFAVADGIGSAVSNVPDGYLVAEDQGRGQSRAATWYSTDHRIVGFLKRLAYLVLQWLAVQQTVGLEEPQQSILGQPLSDSSNGGRTGDLTREVSTHPVGNHKESEVRNGGLTGRTANQCEQGIFVV